MAPDFCTALTWAFLQLQKEVLLSRWWVLKKTVVKDKHTTFFNTHLTLMHYAQHLFALQL